MDKALLEKLLPITKEEKKLLEGCGKIDTSLYTEKNNFIIDSRKLLRIGKLIEIRLHTRFVHFPKHQHNYIEVVYMYQGSTTHIINDKKIILEEGDLLFLNQQAIQEVLPAKESDIAINFIILPEFFNQMCTIFEEEKSPLSDFLMDCLFKSQKSYSYLYFNVSQILPVQNLVEILMWSLTHNMPNKRNTDQKTMALLLLQLMNHSDKIHDQNSDFKEGLALSVLRYINEKYRDGSLTELAQILNYDLAFTSKQIKKQLGKPFKDLLQEKRMAQAVYLLKQTQFSVAEIIELIGYENTSFFYRKFKSHYGMSPKQYRESTNVLDTKEMDQQKL